MSAGVKCFCISVSYSITLITAHVNPAQMKALCLTAVITDLIELLLLLGLHFLRALRDYNLILQRLQLLRRKLAILPKGNESPTSKVEKKSKPYKEHEPCKWANSMSECVQIKTPISHLLYALMKYLFNERFILCGLVRASCTGRRLINQMI